MYSVVYYDKLYSQKGSNNIEIMPFNWVWQIVYFFTANPTDTTALPSSQTSNIVVGSRSLRYLESIMKRQADPYNKAITLLSY